jgi:outer membrane scaffolding protein for murein synthesis (MipA/OmpV family)
MIRANVLRRIPAGLFTGTTVFLTVALQPGLAADPSTSTGSSAPTFIVTLGGAVEYGPNYPGSGEYAFSALPSFDIRRFDEPDENSAPDDSISYGLIDFGGIEIGPALGFRDSRSQSDDRRLTGLNDVRWDVDLGLFAQYWAVPNQLRFRTEARQALSNGSGLELDLGVDWFQPLNDKWTLSVGPRVSYGNGAYMRKYFSVAPDEALRNGSLPSFDAGSGFKSLGLTVSATYDFSPTWSLQVYDRFDRLVGDAAASPVTSELGSRNQNIIGVSLSKSFSVNF